MRRFRSPLDRWLPVGYLGLVLALIFALLPTALRPPQEPPNTSAAFDPDEPPDDEILISNLSKASSGTAGSGTTDVGVGPVLGAGPPAKPRFCPGGIGNPPRQVESIYSAPCAVPFSGPNGGATSKGVTANEVRVAIWHTLTDGDHQGSYEGAVYTEPRSGENDVDRTLRALQTYLNQNFQFYGRQLRLYQQKPANNQTAHRNAAVKADQEYKVFAANVVSQPACEEYAQRQVISFCAQSDRGWYRKLAPYAWSWYSDSTQLMELTAEYLCKKLVGKKALFAGDPTLQPLERRFGLFYAEFDEHGHYSPAELEAALDRECGAKLAEKIGYSWADGDAQVGTNSTAIARFKAAGVTTVIMASGWFTGVAFTHQAASQGWFPEWFVPGAGALDHNQVAQITNQQAWKSAFGFTEFEMARPDPDTDCYRAYKAIDVDNNPEYNVCQWLWPALLQIANGIQLSGPILNPANFVNGLYSLGHRFFDNPVWAIGGGFGPGDWDYMDNVAEIWWDPAADSPDGSGLTGAYRYVRGGKRYKQGEIPREDPLVFKDGVTQPPRE